MSKYYVFIQIQYKPFGMRMNKEQGLKNQYLKFAWKSYIYSFKVFVNHCNIWKYELCILQRQVPHKEYGLPLPNPKMTIPKKPRNFDCISEICQSNIQYISTK